MPVQLFPDGAEPSDENTEICRFMEMWKFKDLLKTGELHFARADRFQDDCEGLPPNEYVRSLGFSSLDLRDIHKLNHDLGCLAQFREGFFLNCWYHFTDETARMWQDYGKHGVAVVSRYSLLKAALERCEYNAFLGLVRYGTTHLTGWNVLRFISTKQHIYSHEREIRALLWVPDPLAGNNRHLDENNVPHPQPLTEPPERIPKALRLRVEVNSLITEVLVSPWASETAIFEVEEMMRSHGYMLRVRPSAVSRFRTLLPET